MGRHLNRVLQIRVSPPDLQVTIDAIGGNAGGIDLFGLFDEQKKNVFSIDANQLYAPVSQI